MHLTLNARLVGLGVGIAAGLLFVLLGWRSFLILLAFSLFGLLVGFWLDARPALLKRVIDALSRLFAG